MASSQRNANKLATIAVETDALTIEADASDPASVQRAFTLTENHSGSPEVVIYNASARPRGPLAELNPEDVRHSIEVTAFGAFLAVREAAKRMIPRGRGAILLTGATAGLKGGYSGSAPFAMGKFALRGLAQSAARELGPKGIHVAHVVVDGSVRSDDQPDPADKPDSTLSADSIAQSYLNLLRQPQDAWTLELDLRPWGEAF